MKPLIFTLILLTLASLTLGCRATIEERQTYHEPAPQQTYQTQPVSQPQPKYEEPRREEIIEERTTTRVISEETVID